MEVTTNQSPSENQQIPSHNAAAHRTFDAAELLEALLLHVDARTLLVSTQRVSKQFKTAIDSSIHIQRVLWFESDPKRQPDRPEGRAPYDQPEGAINPFFHRTNERAAPGLTKSRLLEYAFHQESRNPTEAWLRIDESHMLSFPDGSWRRMILAEFPKSFGVFGVGGVYTHTGVPLKAGMAFSFSYPRGYTMGEFVDNIMEEVVPEFPESYGYVDGKVKRLSEGSHGTGE